MYKEGRGYYTSTNFIRENNRIFIHFLVATWFLVNVHSYVLQQQKCTHVEGEFKSLSNNTPGDPG